MDVQYDIYTYLNTAGIARSPEKARAFGIVIALVEAVMEAIVFIYLVEYIEVVKIRYFLMSTNVEMSL
jgi:hypothetical protein